MAVTPFEFPPLFKKPKNVEIPKRLGIRAVVVDSSNNFLLTLQDILNPDLSLMFGKMHVIKKYSRFSRFLLLRQDFSTLLHNIAPGKYIVIKVELNMNYSCTSKYFLTNQIEKATTKIIIKMLMILDFKIFSL